MMSTTLDARTRALPLAWTSESWLEHYRANAELRRPIPWERGPEITPSELAVLGPSLRSWQRGETSDGNHLRGVAARHADHTGDPVFCDVVELFIREEQRHGELMGLFLDSVGLDRLQSDWGDRLFRPLRHASTERAICNQILADEAAHIRFQAEQFAAIFRRRSAWYRWRVLATQGVLFRGAIFAMWWLHGGVLRAGGYDHRRFCASASKIMRRAWGLMDPSRYEWPAPALSLMRSE